MIKKFFYFVIFIFCLFLTSCGSSSGESSSNNMLESNNTTVLRSENNEIVLNLPNRFEDALTDEYASLGYESFYEDEQTIQMVGLFNQETSNSFTLIVEYTEEVYEVCGDRNATLYTADLFGGKAYYSKLNIEGNVYFIAFSDSSIFGTSAIAWTKEEVKAILDTCPDQ